MVSDYLPQKNGKFYTLAKTFGKDGVAVTGADNWLSDSYTNEDITRYKAEQLAAKETKPPRASDTEKAPI